MSLILTIDTATEKAHVSIAKDGLVINTLYSDSQKNHAAFLQAAIKELTSATGTNLKDIDAVAITAGPGSYTGLRVGMASAKGLCYALQKPLIAIGTLEVLAASALPVLAENKDENFLCPMIDARRMEVFTAVYDQNLNVIMQPCALILNESSYEKLLAKNKIFFFGNGSEKWKTISKNDNSSFIEVEIQPTLFSKLACSYYARKQFTNLIYSEPLYIKDFQAVKGK